jgi:hypothetical protein
MKTRSSLAVLLVIATAGCGDNGGSPDALRPSDGRIVDGGVTIDGPAAADASVDAGAAVAGDLCSNAEPIMLTGGMATITATTAAPYTHNYEPGVCAQVNSGGNDRVHSITVPNGERLAATVDPTSATFDPGIFVIAGPAANCDAVPIVCLTQNDNGGDGQDDAITFDNTGAAPVDVFIMIDGFRPDGEPYTLVVNVAPIP